MILYLSMLETESDRDVFQKLYEENRQKLFCIADKILRNEADAEDAVHTCFLKVADKFAEYRHQPYVNLVRLSCTITRHAATDIAREYEKKGNFTSEVHQGEDDVPDISPDILDQLIERHDKHLITQAVMQLKMEEREFLHLQYGLELKPRVIGELLGMTPEIVRKKIFRCRRRLAKILEDDEYEGLR